MRASAARPVSPPKEKVLIASVATSAVKAEQRIHPNQNDVADAASMSPAYEHEADPAEAVEVAVEGRFADESVESAWADAQELQLTQKRHEILAEASIVQSVECRTTLCRARISGTADTEKTLEEAFHGADPIWKGQALVQRNETAGGIVLNAYFAREGTALSAPDG